MNQVNNVNSILLDLNQFDQFNNTYDIVLSTGMFGEGFTPINILNIWRKLLNIGGEAFLIIADQKEEAKKLI